MNSEGLTKENKAEIKDIKKDLVFAYLKRSYILQKIFDYTKKNKFLKIIKYNKKLRERLNLSIQNYKEYSETFIPIEIEIIPYKKKKVNLLILLKMNLFIIYILMIKQKKQKNML